MSGFDELKTNYQCWSPQGRGLVIEDNFEVLGLGLGLESRVLGLGLAS